MDEEVRPTELRRPLNQVCLNHYPVLPPKLCVSGDRAQVVSPRHLALEDWKALDPCCPGLGSHQPQPLCSSTLLPPNLLFPCAPDLGLKSVSSCPQLNPRNSQFR